MKPVLALLASLLTLMPLAAQSAETAWTEIMPGARMRAISAGTEIGGRALIGLEVDLDQGINTYWRVPGETGLPTTLEVSGPQGARDVEMLWPLPEWDLNSGYVDLVYRGEIVLPALVDAPKDVPLTLAVTMGVCSDICVPVRTHFDLPAAASADPGNALRLKQAVNRTPIDWDGPDAPLFDIGFDRETGDLAVGFDPVRIEPMQVFPSLDGTGEVFSAPDIDRDENILRFSLLARNDDSTWRDAALRLTFATEDGPYEIVQKLETR